VKDSFDYYFNKENVMDFQRGYLYYCPLPESGEFSTSQFYYISSDTSLVLVKTLNLQDSSLVIEFFRTFVINENGDKCWFPDLVSIKYNSSNEIVEVRFFNGYKEPPFDELRQLKFK
jgi:hypothetical protein